MKKLSCEKCGCARHGMIKKAVIVKQTKTVMGERTTMTLCYMCFVAGITGLGFTEIPPEVRKPLMLMADEVEVV